MDMEQLQYFCTLAECLNFTKAADILYISQPTLSRQISLLESELNVSLLTRDNRKVQLTRAGEVLYKGAQDVLYTIKVLKEDVQQAARDTGGCLRIASINFFYPELYNVYRTFTTQYPSTLFSIFKVNNDLFQKSVINGNADIGVGFSFDLSQPPEELGLEVLPLYNEHFSVVMSNQHKFAGQQYIPLEQLREEHLLFLNQPTLVPFVSSIWDAAGFTKSKNVDPRQPESIESVLLHVKADNQCISIVPRPVVDMMPDGCTCADITGLDSRFQVIMIWRKGNQSSQLSAFLSCIRESFENGPLNPISQ